MSSRRPTDDEAETFRGDQKTQVELGADSAGAQAPSGPAPLLVTGSVVAERFRIDSFLASGGMGEVYRATHVFLKRPVALKVLRGDLSQDADLRARFEREALLLSKLESPHVVRVHDFGKTVDHRFFLAMEYVEGRPFDEICRAEQRLEPGRAIGFLRQLCTGLGEAHALGIVHRDLKPANLMLTRRRDGGELLKILDFGIARLSEDTPVNPLTAEGVVIGTPTYMAPEQARGGRVDARTDIYALGCVAYRMLCGRPPFTGESLYRVVAQQLSATPEDPVNLEPALAAYPELVAAVRRALAKEPADRFASVQDFAAALGGGAASAASSAPQGLTAFPDWPVGGNAPAPVDEAWPPPDPAHGQQDSSAVAEVEDFFAMRSPAEKSGPSEAAPTKSSRRRDGDGE